MRPAKDMTSQPSNGLVAFSAVTILLILAILPPINSSAQTSPDEQKITLSHDYAQFVGITQEQGVFTEIVLFVGDEQLCFSFIQYRPDPFEYLVNLDGFDCTEMSEGDFEVSRSLSSASLGPIGVSAIDQVSGEEKTISITASWTGIGEKSHLNKHLHTTLEDGAIINVHSNDASISAAASIDISGDINFDMQDVLNDSTYFGILKEGDLTLLIDRSRVSGDRNSASSATQKEILQSGGRAEIHSSQEEAGIKTRLSFTADDSGDFVLFTFYRIDTNTQEYIEFLDAQFELDEGDFYVSPSLSSATLEPVTVIAHDVLNGEEKTITISASFMGTGEIQVLNSHAHSTSDNSHRVLKQRDASYSVEISGDSIISLEGTDGLIGTERN